MLDLLEWLLQCLSLPYVRLDGSTAVAERLTTVDMCAPLSALFPKSHDSGSYIL